MKKKEVNLIRKLHSYINFLRNVTKKFAEKNK